MSLRGYTQRSELGLDYAVCTAGCGVEVALGWPARMACTFQGSQLDEMLWSRLSGTCGGEAPEMSKKLGGLAVAHVLKRKEVAVALLSRGGQPPHQLHPERGVVVSLQRRGDDIPYFRGVPVVQLQDHTVELGFLDADAGQGKLCLILGNHEAGRSCPERRKSHGHSGYFRWY
jgi:hypothetical protein